MTKSIVTKKSLRPGFMVDGSKYVLLVIIYVCILVCNWFTVEDLNLSIIFVHSLESFGVVIMFGST